MPRTALDKESLCDRLCAAARLLREESGLLGDIDSRFGDGDHGVTMNKIAAAIEDGSARWRVDTTTSLRNFLASLGDAIMAVGGGSAGPLYGTLVGGLAEPLSGEEEIDASTLKAMLRGAYGAMCDITKARIGDKTMMDALIPAVEAAECAPDDVGEILSAAAAAAASGARETEKYVSRFGRARSYGEQTIGTPDAGAMSTAILFRGLAGIGDKSVR